MTLRHRERGQHRVVELQLDLRPFGNEQRVVARFRQVAEHVAHLGRALDVEVVALESQSIRIAHERARLHAQQRIVGLGVVRLGVVTVVGREQRRADRARDVEQRLAHALVVVEAVVLQPR